ncbi:cob(I)yrinic acid a,c-diamide adenosyltransferase [Patescibacteria group bacterium]|nr:cob(I)yrinic acid a,c-diamide adenosyltransferase [Patescibacteria group bacterium]
MTIYTKKGDRGETCLFGNQKTLKKSLRINTIGTIDELNSYLGVVVSFSESSELNRVLKQIQKDLLTIGSILAGSKLQFSKSKTKNLEKIIDKLEAKLPSLKHFIIPGGSLVASHLHFARSLARRAEREVVALSQKGSTQGRPALGWKIKPPILAYLNRLSDLLFMLARDENYNMRVREEKWEVG